MVVAFDQSAWALFLVGETGLTTQATMIVGAFSNFAHTGVCFSKYVHSVFG